MCTAGIRERTGGGLAAWLLAFSVAQAAEVVGVVLPSPEGGFQPGAAGISVSLQPLEGQALPRQAPAQRHRVLVRDGGFQPPFITLRTGDTLHFINQDEAHHELFALSSTQPIELALNKQSSGAAAEAEVRLVSEGVWHLFCRIHGRSYARVDAVATPLQRMVAPGETFRFEGLEPGQWQLRVAAPGAGTRVLRAAAMTSPPPLRIELAGRGDAQPTPRPGTSVTDRVEALFPRD